MSERPAGKDRGKVPYWVIGLGFFGLTLAGVVFGQFLGSQLPKPDEAPVADKPAPKRTKFDVQPSTDAPETTDGDGVAVKSGSDSPARDGADGAPANGDAPEDGGPEPFPEALDGVEITVWPATADGIRGAMKEIRPGVKNCYEEALKEVPDLAGKLTVAFEVADRDGIGKVEAVQIADGTLEDGPMEDCVLDVVQSLQLDPGMGTVNYPFIFRNDPGSE